MSKRLFFIFFIGVFFFFGSSNALMAHEHGGMGSTHDIAVKGEIVDSLCYLGMGAKGPSHKQCGIDCAKAGIPVSIVEEGTGKVYVLMSNQDKTGLPDSVTHKMGETVTIKGDLYSTGGSQIIAVEEVS